LTGSQQSLDASLGFFCFPSFKLVRPDIVLRSEDQTIIIDTKWKRPTNRQPSVEDLRQMYTYARCWDTDKVILLYPGKPFDSKFISYKNKLIDQRDHECKVAFVDVLDEERKLDKWIGKKVINTLQIEL